MKELKLILNQDIPKDEITIDKIDLSKHLVLASRKFYGSTKETKFILKVQFKENEPSFMFSQLSDPAYGIDGYHPTIKECIESAVTLEFEIKVIEI